MSVLAQQSALTRVSTLAANAINALDRVPLSLPQLLARLALSGVFFRSGMTKIANWDLTIQLFQDEYRVPILPPDVAALMASSVELAVPVFLVAGFLTRLACLPLLGMTAVIQIFVYPASWPDHLTWTALSVFLLIRGAGAISLDHFIFRSWRR